MTRVWDTFLTEQDTGHLAKAEPARSVGFGRRAAVLMVDNYRKALGDEPLPLLDAIETWPSSTGLAGWRALERIEELLRAARAADLPVVHAAGLSEEESGLRTRRRAVSPAMTPEQRDRHRRRYEIVEQAAPVEGEAVVRKVAPSAFFGTPLVSHLNALGVDTLIVGGESTSGCVRASVVDAFSYGYRVVLAEECVYDRHEAAHAINLFDMDRKYADVLPLADILSWIAGAAEAPTEARAEGRPA